MKTLKLVLPFLLVQSLVTTTYAQTDALEFITPRDMLSANYFSNISLKNNGGTAATVYGLYVRQFSYVAQGGTCAQATQIYPASQNAAVGAMVTPIEVGAGKSTAVGSNYLYNMILQAIYYSLVNVFTPQCQLPGCTWGNDSIKYNWCIYLGALAPITTSGETSNVPPSAFNASSGSYNYNLVTNFTNIGPISCNDQTLTCTAANQQTQTFS